MDRSTLALLLYGVYFAVAFGIRTVVQLRRTGDHGFRVGVERPGSLEWWARIGFIGALALSLAAAVLAATGVLAPIDAFDATATTAAGVAVTVAGIVGTFAVQVAMGESWRVGVDPAERTALVVRGPFKAVRNPIFTTMVLTAVGFTLLVPSWLAIVGLATLVVGLELQVRAVEEPYLRRVHGDAYADYCSAVGRFVPGLGRMGTRHQM